VDDILICIIFPEWIAAFEAAMAVKLHIKYMGQHMWLLEIIICRDIPRKQLTIHQATYIRELMRRFGRKDCKPASAPTSANDPNETALVDDAMPSRYRRIVGALLYALVTIRPYRMETLSRLYRFMSKATCAHMKDAKACLRYLQRTADTPTAFGGNETPRLQQRKLLNH
jgi:hypothetical protein